MERPGLVGLVGGFVAAIKAPASAGPRHWPHPARVGAPRSCSNVNRVRKSTRVLREREAKKPLSPRGFARESVCLRCTEAYAPASEGSHGHCRVGEYMP